MSLSHKMPELYLVDTERSLRLQDTYLKIADVCQMDARGFFGIVYGVKEVSLGTSKSIQLHTRPILQSLDTAVFKT